MTAFWRTCSAHATDKAEIERGRKKLSAVGLKSENLGE